MGAMLFPLLVVVTAALAVIGFFLVTRYPVSTWRAGLRNLGEAALDDTNLGRLLEIFAELRESSQLIIVTHQKRTMEVADALYGVSMRGDGVTTVVSQRIRDVAATA